MRVASGFALLAALGLIACGRIGYDPLPRDDAAAPDSATLFDSSVDAQIDSGIIDGSTDLPLDATSDAPVVLPEILVSPVSGLLTSELGGTATFTVVLASMPTHDVAIAISSSNTTEGTVSPASVVFTVLNWNAPQTVTATGVDDPDVDGDQAYVIELAPATSTDPNYDALDATDVSVTNVDDETAGITITPTSGLVTTEGGGADTFTIVLNALPTSDVTVDVVSATPLEAVASPISVTFTTSNWSSPQTITVTGVDDAIQDDDVVFTITTAPAESDDSRFNGLDAANVTGTNLDDETAGILVSPTSGLFTTEAAGTAMFTVVLQSQPSADVTISVSSSDTTEGTVATASLTFTSTTWNMAQSVTVTGVDDFVADGDQIFQIMLGSAVSADADYAGFIADEVAVTNIDDDSPGITVMPLSGLTTTESGGTATFSVTLDSQPTADVVLTLTSTDLSEGLVSPATITFSMSDWSMPQTVTLTGVDDAVADGSQMYESVVHVMASADPAYAMLADARVSAINADDETAGVTVSSTSGLVTTEAGATAAFTIVLTSEPTADVTISVTSSNLAEGTVAPASVTFTSMNWSVPQTVTVSGVDDALDDGNVVYGVVTGLASSSDLTYDGINPSDVSLSNTDNDVAGVTVSPTSGLTTTEAGGTAMFTLVLTSQPTADVTIALASSNTAEGTVSSMSVLFTSMNWMVAQAITVTGVDDVALDGNVAYSIVNAAAASADGSYNGLSVADVGVTNTDNDAITPVQQAYVKASNTAANDRFGQRVALSADGNTMAVTGLREDSNATGINGDQTNNLAGDSGAVYVFTRSGATWTQQAYIKASNTGAGEDFGEGIALSSDGNTLVVGSPGEGSNATGIDGNQADNSAPLAGATYIFTRAATVWTQQAYIKASNTNALDRFGFCVALSSDGNTLAVGARVEASNATGVDGNQADNSASAAGAVYMFSRAGAVWSQQTYIKASNTDAGDYFGYLVALSSDGNTLIVVARLEGSGATGIGGNQADNSVAMAGAVYAFTRSGMVWTQEAYIKASNTGGSDFFGTSIALAADGNTLAVGASQEASNATGIDGNQLDNSAPVAGAVYLFTRAGVIWSQQAYIKATNTQSNDYFGYSVSLSADGNKLVVGAVGEASNATGIGGNQANNALAAAGAAYELTRTGVTWAHRVYIKASNTGGTDQFGASIALSADGNTLAVGANQEASNATGIGGLQTNNAAMSAGAVYVFTGT
jgi:hypothetical protein